MNANEMEDALDGMTFKDGNVHYQFTKSNAGKLYADVLSGDELMDVHSLDELDEYEDSLKYWYDKLPDMVKTPIPKKSYEDWWEEHYGTATTGWRSDVGMIW